MPLARTRRGQVAIYPLHAEKKTLELAAAIAGVSTGAFCLDLIRRKCWREVERIVGTRDSTPAAAGDRFNAGPVETEFDQRAFDRAHRQVADGALRVVNR
jgi:hypothetical protein